jgi:arsenate reductase
MAEAIVNHELGGEWLAFSAGNQPAGYVHPLALRALDEIGIRHEGESKHIDTFRGQEFDAAITVCDDADEACPVWLGKGHHAHIGFPDPARAEGSEEKQMVAFRSVRDDIRGQIVAYLQHLA